MPLRFTFNSPFAAGDAASVVVVYDMGPGVSVRDFVFQSTTVNQVNRADATSIATGEAIGVVRAINTPNPGECEVLVHGLIGGFAGLVTGGRFLLGIAPGAIVLSTDLANVNYPDNAGNLILPLGYARNATTLFVDVEDYTVF